MLIWKLPSFLANATLPLTQRTTRSACVKARVNAGSTYGPYLYFNISPFKAYHRNRCHGYHSEGDQRLPETFRCFECRLRGDPAIGLFSERKVLEMIAKYKDLALFRCVMPPLLPHAHVADGRSLHSRALKIVEVENPENVTSFRKLVGMFQITKRGCRKPMSSRLQSGCCQAGLETIRSRRYS